MTFDATLLHPKSGSLAAVLFENPNRGIPRSLFWDIDLNFESFTFEDNNESPNLMVDWLRFAPGVTEFSRGGSFSNRNQPMAECSIYLNGVHVPAENWLIRLSPLPGERRWTLEYDVSLRVNVFRDDPTWHNVSGSCTLTFGGFHLVKRTFPGTVWSRDEAVRMLSEFFPLDDHATVEDAGFKYVVTLP